MSEIVKYFGYGANRDPKMISFITGKPVSELDGHPAVLQNFGLAIQSLSQVPDILVEDSVLPESPRAILKREWGDDFKSYVIFPRQGGRVEGTIWHLSAEDRERVRDWELVGDWYHDDVGIAVTAEGEEVNIITESMGRGQQFDHEVDGLRYGTWLQPSHMFEAIATKTRHEYDERLRGPEGTLPGTKP